MSEAKRKETIERIKKEKFEREHKLIDGINHKLCNKHHIYFPDESPWMPATEECFYHNDKNKTDHLYPYCKRCGITEATQWKRDNPKKRKINAKRYRQKPNTKKIKRTNEEKKRGQGKRLATEKQR